MSEDILLVEDDISNQMAATVLLKRLGYTVDVVSSGKEAIRTVARKQYALILMDVAMPEMDGLETAKRIRKSECQQKTRTPIIALTASDEKQHCLDAGMDDYIAKPYTQGDLKKVMDRWLNPPV